MVGSSTDTISIPLSKFNIAMLTLASVAFVLLAVWLLSIAGGRDNAPLLIFFALFSFLLFGGLGVYGLSKLFDSKAGLVLDDVGLINNSSAIAKGRIPWAEIQALRITEVRNQRFLTVFVDSAEKYINRGNFIQRKINAANNRLYGSPIQISAQALQIGFDELVEIVDQYHDRFGRT